MTLTNLMQSEYVKGRYELDTVKVYAPMSEGGSTVVFATQHDADLVIYIAAGKSEGAALVNLSTLICNESDSPDVQEHIVSYYEELPKYANTSSDDLFKFADQLVAKFIVGDAIEEYQYNQLECVIEDIRLSEKDSYVIVQSTHAIKQRLNGRYDPMNPGSGDNNCFICDVMIEPGQTLCRACINKVGQNN